jgi:hypothetical protein
VNCFFDRTLIKETFVMQLAVKFWSQPKQRYQGKFSWALGFSENEVEVRSIEVNLGHA